jgi:hypothetical protein
LFDSLTEQIDVNYSGYKVLRAEVEPGISWDDFRADRRGLLLWLTRIHSNPVDHLRDLLQDQSEDDKAKFRLALGVIEKQIKLVRRQIQRIHQNVDHSEKQLTYVFHAVSKCIEDEYDDSEHPGPVSSDVNGSAIKFAMTPEYNPKESADWSVVEDEDDDDKELTSASLSGYDEYDSF